MNNLKYRSPALGRAADTVAGQGFAHWAPFAAPRQWDIRVFCALAATGLLLIGFSATWLMPARCQPLPIEFAIGASTDASVATRAGQACTISVEIGSAIIRTVSIETNPTHGRLMLRGRTGVIYVPDRDFKGKDVFAFALDGTTGREAGVSLVRVAATVR